MAEIQKPKRARRSPLGMPPSADESRNNLQEPEAAPSVHPVQEKKKTSQQGRGDAKKAAQSSTKKAAATYDAADGRTLRKTGRTEQFSTRVHPDFKQELFDVAQTTGKNYNVILEESLELYKKHMLGA